MYTLELKPRARKDLQRLDASVRAQVVRRLQWLCRHCDETKHKALKGKHRGKFRLKVAEVYRVLYNFDTGTRVLTVHRIGHRRNVY